MPRSDGPLMVAIEGSDGVGKGAVIEHLLEHGVPGLMLAHFKHDARRAHTEDGWCMANTFASQRAAYARVVVERRASALIDVILCDRWFWSTRVEALTRGVPDATQNAMLALVVAERAEYDGRVARGELRPMRTILLDAPTKVLEARTTQRDGKVHPNLAAIRSEYLSLAKNLGWPVVSTDCPIEEAAAKVTKIIDEWVSEESDS